MKTQVLGLGNTLLTDDAAGVRVVERLKTLDCPPGVILTVGGTGGQALMDLIHDADRLIIVDAVMTGAEPGTVHETPLADILPGTPAHLGSLHGFDLQTVMALRENVLDCKTPKDVTLVGIEAADVTTFSEQCTPAVTRALDLAADLILARLNRQD